MTTIVENNMKSSNNKDRFEQRAHYIPSKVESDGAASVDKYFDTYIAEKDDGELSASDKTDSAARVFDFKYKRLKNINKIIKEGDDGLCVDKPNCSDCLYYGGCAPTDRRSEHFANLLTEEFKYIPPCMHTQAYVNILNYLENAKNCHSNEMEDASHTSCYR